MAKILKLNLGKRYIKFLVLFLQLFCNWKLIQSKKILIRKNIIPIPQAFVINIQYCEISFAGSKKVQRPGNLKATEAK